MELHKRETEVLVIGAGGAGLRAALAAAESGSEVILVNKGPISRSGTTLTAAGGCRRLFIKMTAANSFFRIFFVAAMGWQIKI